jgi:aldose sugar dehydrogenase
MRGISSTVFLLFCAVGHASAEPRDTASGQVLVEKMVDQLDEPWSIAFLPSGATLITLRDGRLLLVASDGSRTNVEGVPQVFATGQGGLLDVVLARDFAQSRQVFITFAEPRPDGAGTALAVATLDEGQSALTDLDVIFRQNTSSFSKVHFGGRVVEAVDGTLFLTIGERGEGDLAQSMDVHNGKVVRVKRDGTIPADNPFVDSALPEIWSLGHGGAWRHGG